MADMKKVYDDLTIINLYEDLFWNILKNKFKNAMEKRLIFMIDLFIFLKVVFDNNKGNSFSDMWQKLTIVWSS